ncbi:thiamine diphosphokinase [Bacillus lacus]|uniref:Thiamine diphosphokinase n=2 Tax=Metabacillus lacus TaxID=1983721 RepID=A0A7X2LYD2_9BACI|nr:thiamine diphosphokinase [Metabacillus lacus]
MAGGPSSLLPPLETYIDEEAIWIGVDRGVLYLLENGIIPVRGFGDFDSITEAEREYLHNYVPHLSVFPAEKDTTDTELALQWAVNQNPDRIYIFGATGGRLDHLFANVQLLSSDLYVGADITLIDTLNEVSVHVPGSYEAELLENFPYISFVPISAEVENLTLEGFKYPLKNCHISMGSTLCISNELVASKGTFSFTNGILMMVRSRD